MIASWIDGSADSDSCQGADSLTGDMVVPLLLNILTISWLEFSAVCWERTAVILIGNVILMVCCMYLAENGLQF